MAENKNSCIICYIFKIKLTKSEKYKAVTRVSKDIKEKLESIYKKTACTKHDWRSQIKKENSKDGFCYLVFWRRASGSIWWHSYAASGRLIAAPSRRFFRSHSVGASQELRGRAKRTEPPLRRWEETLYGSSRQLESDLDQTVTMNYSIRRS